MSFIFKNIKEETERQRYKRNMTVEMALGRLLNTDSDESGGQSGLEDESDGSDNYWVAENCSSSESELEDNWMIKRHSMSSDPNASMTAEMSGEFS